MTKFLSVLWIYFCIGLGFLMSETHGFKDWKKYPAQAIIASGFVIIAIWPALVFGRMWIAWRK